MIVDNGPGKPTVSFRGGKTRLDGVEEGKAPQKRRKKASSKQRGLSIVRKMLDLSTAHIPEDILAGERDDPFGTVRHVEHDYGFVVFVPSMDGIEERCPPWLRPILKYAGRHHAVVVNFDRDAAVASEFESFCEEVK